MTARDTLADLERQRLQLEENISQLQKSLYHWRLWEAEYDALKEEIAALKDGSTREEFLRTGREFGGALINEDEMKKLLGDSQGLTRSRQQVVDLISRRIDYVKENVGVMEKRLATAEHKLSTLLIVEQPGVINEEGLPLTEITEELDENDVVISSTTSNPNDGAPHLMEALKKAGIRLPESEQKEVTSKVKQLATKPKTATEQLRQRLEEKPQVSKSDRRDDSKVQQPGRPQPSTAVTSLVNGNNTITREQDAEDDEPVVMEVDESPEDAALRREMLQYGLNEVGAVVAELDLDDDGSEFFIDDEEDYMFSDEEEDEDEYGRTTRQVIDEDYRRHMMELEKKLDARSIHNVGPDPSLLPQEIRDELDQSGSPKVVAAENIVVEKKPEEAPKKKPKKKVAFADELDVAPEPQPAPKLGPEKAPEPEVPTMQESIVERSGPAKKAPPQPSAPMPRKKMSRFKSAKVAETEAPAVATQSIAPEPVAETSKPAPATPSVVSRDTLSEPGEFAEGATMRDGLVERESSQRKVSAPDFDEFDEALHQKEIATEFYKVRNRMIQREGGFLDDGEQQFVPLDEEDADGKPKKKMSRFMAARLQSETM